MKWSNKLFSSPNNNICGQKFSNLAFPWRQNELWQWLCGTAKNNYFCWFHKFEGKVGGWGVYHYRLSFRCLSWCWHQGADVGNKNVFTNLRLFAVFALVNTHKMRAFSSSQRGCHPCHPGFEIVAYRNCLCLPLSIPSRKILAKGTTDQGIEYFDSFNTFGSEQQLQQALKSWSNFSLVLFGKGQEKHKRTSTNPCNKLKISMCQLW